ncbi:hypothetical protein [Trabulsiella odontotermitis]|uniref:Uncharacterized protein n=1 Tax=Trabulsiella odontotermitis TaxID=379893 RepID=A0A0L0GY02_9ENTR|nr:hypothetical protein [Trabulsiella odontotermitis]KNC93629.1 hypothetical protein GM31_18775 [Trabulsiella odontotermitis]
MAKRNAGWARPVNASKHHYFKEDEVTSICGRWMLFSDIREPDTFESPDDCKECRKRVNALAVRGDEYV